MADTEWFEERSIGEAKEERIIVGEWVATVVALIALLCVVAYVTNP